MLERIRGTLEVEDEFMNLCGHAQRAQRQQESSWLLIVQRRYRPQLVLAALCPVFQLFTGVSQLEMHGCETVGGGMLTS